MASAPSAFVVHVLPGRVRLRFPALRGDGSRLAALARAAADLAGVAEAQVFAASGSLLIHHNGTLEALLDEAARQGHFTTEAGLPPPPELPALPLGALVPAAGAVAAAGLALLQLARREALPPALTLGWHAVVLARMALQRGGAPMSATPASDPPPG